MRLMTLFLIIVGFFGNCVIDLSACGDKFLRIGRSMRYGRYVAMYPASIIIYAPHNSVPAQITDLASVLKRAGHSPLLVAQSVDLSSAMASGKYDLVLAGLDQASQVISYASGAASPPAIIPVLIKPSDADLAAAKALSTCVIRSPLDNKNDALAEIDHRMELRIKSTVRGRSR